MNTAECSKCTYNLVDARDLGLEDGDSVTNGWLLVGNGSGSESSVGHVDQSLLLRVSRDELRQHIVFLSIIFIFTYYKFDRR